MQCQSEIGFNKSYKPCRVCRIILIFAIGCREERIMHSSQKTHIVRFRRWSNKGYAAFSSLKVCVSVGVVTFGILRQAIKKCRNMIFVCMELFRSYGERLGDDSPGLMADDVSLHLMESCGVRCNHAMQESAYACNIKFNNINMRM